MSCECPICFENIEIAVNRVTTECGHIFHCSCLLQNAAHNGFGCPYCRKELAEELIEEEDEEYEDEDDEDFVDEEERFLDGSLTSFRMFHQRLSEEEIEEESEVQVFPEVEYSDYRMADGIPNAEFVSRKLLERGISHEELVRSLLFMEHNNTLGGRAFVYENKSSQVYGQICAIIHQSKQNYLRNPNSQIIQIQNEQIEEINNEIQIQNERIEEINNEIQRQNERIEEINESLIISDIAEEKITDRKICREFISQH